MRAFRPLPTYRTAPFTKIAYTYAGNFSERGPEDVRTWVIPFNLMRRGRSMLHSAALPVFRKLALHARWPEWVGQDCGLGIPQRPGRSTTALGRPHAVDLYCIHVKAFGHLHALLAQTVQVTRIFLVTSR